MRSMLWERNAYACGGQVAVLCGVRIITGLQALYGVRNYKRSAASTLSTHWRYSSPFGLQAKSKNYRRINVTRGDIQLGMRR